MGFEGGAGFMFCVSVKVLLPKRLLEVWCGECAG